MKKTLSIILITVTLMGLGLGSDTAKEIAVRLYCNVQPHDCSDSK